MLIKIFKKIITVKNIYLKDGILTLINYIFVKLKLPFFIYDFKINNFDEFISYLHIYETGHNLVRIGSDTDGGYLLPDILNEIDFCYSPGVGESTIFEDQILMEYKIKSYLADGTIENLNTDHEFINKNIDVYNSKKTINFEDWVNSTNKDNNNLMLQMDIEGAELEILYKLDTNFLKKFKILVIEFHDLVYIKNKIAYKVFFNIFKKLNQTHTITHIHPNNMTGDFIFNNNRLPKLAEITFLRNDLVIKKEKIKNALPHSLDRKNYKSNPDNKLSSIFYK